ncbi:hypothetical protein PENTCL1PPCAC_25299, partial [Pristionchus entomophagus]
RAFMGTAVDYGQPRLQCNSETINNGSCFGYAVCGFCYGYIDDGSIPEEEKDNFYDTFNLIVIGAVLPAIGMFGLLGNTISSFIYSRKEMRSSMNVYLCALACSDIIIIITSFFLFVLESMRKRSIFAHRLYATAAPYMFPLGLSAQSLSVFLTVTAAADCLVLVRKSFQTVIIIVLLALAYNAPHLFEIYVIDCWSLPYKKPSKDVCPTELRGNEMYVSIYYAWMYTIVMAAGPLLLLILINTSEYENLRFFYKENTSISHDCDSGDVITLILVVALFVTCNILPLTVNLLEMLMQIENPYLIDLSNLMVVVNSSCNFLIYYAFGSNFRRTLKQYCRRSRVFIRRAATRSTRRRRRRPSRQIKNATFEPLPVTSLIIEPNKEFLV